MATFQRMRLVSADEARRAYPSDLTDPQWALLAPLLWESPAPGPGRPLQVDLREVVNALLYIKQTGCPWRYLPHDFPPRSTVHYYFNKWTAEAPGRPCCRGCGSGRASRRSMRPNLRPA